MKVYLANGTYFETQAEAKAEAKSSGKGFEAVDLPFGASPKADFIVWLNEQQAGIAKLAKIVNAPIVVGEPYESALPAFQPRKPMIVQAGPPTPADIAADREKVAARLDRISIEEEIHSCDARRLGTLADCVANRFHELAKGLS